MNDLTKEFKDKMASNIWETNFDEVINIIKDCSTPDPDKPWKSKTGWSWSNNIRCKYISLRIDMRDGGFIIMDADGKRISLDQLKYQYSGEENE